MQYGGLDLAIRDFALFKHRFLCKYRLLNRVSLILAYFRDLGKRNFYIRDPCSSIFPFVNRTRDPPVRPSFIEGSAVMHPTCSDRAVVRLVTGNAQV